LARVIPAYPRAFDLVLADALYAKAPFFNFRSLVANTFWWFSKRTPQSLSGCGWIIRPCGTSAG